MSINSKVEVEVVRVFLTVEKKKVRLTLPVAKQFPILQRTQRWLAAVDGEPQPEPICKIQSKVLGRSYPRAYKWLYLVQDEEAGLAWVPPVVFQPDARERTLAAGGWCDNLRAVPTAIL